MKYLLILFTCVSFGQFNPIFFSSNPKSAPFEAEYTAILNQAVVLGYTLPGMGQQIKDNKVVKQLKAEGIWDELDLLYMFKRSSSEADFAKINWKDPTQFLLTSATPPTFENNAGYKGNGTTMSFNTNYTPSTQAVKGLLDNIAVFHGVYTLTVAGNSWGTRDNSTNNFLAGNTETVLHGATGGSADGGGNAVGDYLVIKDGTTHNRYLAGVFNTTKSYASSSLSSKPLYLFALNNNATIQNFSSAGLKYFGIGSKLIEPKALRLYQILNNL